MRTLKNFNFRIPTKVVYGGKQIVTIGDEIPARIRKILMVTDPNLFEKTNIIERIDSLLSGFSVFIYKEIDENPTFKSIERGGKIANDNRTDLVLGVGGGSAMDAAKGIAVCATNPGRLASFVAGKVLTNDPLPIICIPTTSGTGSEVTPFAVFTDPDDEDKQGYSSNSIFPKCSIIDPELTYSMPEPVILNTGLDSLAHAVEAYLSTESFEMNDQLALHSIDLVLDNLAEAIQGKHEAMDVMAYSAMLSGISIAHASTILPHIMGYPLTVYHSIPHGRAGIILLPVFLDFLREKQASFGKIQILDSKFKKFGSLNTFLNQLGVSINLRDYGVDESELEKYVKKTIIKGDVAITPAEINEEVILHLYQQSM